jgi:hypothetical protein
MNELIKLPEIFKGKWDHLLILTYGADLPYFENVILRSDFRCRNKTILADGQKFLKACERYEKDGRVRSLNQRYIAEGIYLPNSAHAKIILLTTRESGKLLVGSGNLGQGYTSGGELFTLYEYSTKDTSQLSAFQSVWNLVDTLLKRDMVGGAAVQSLRELYAGTPWLMQTSKNPDSMVVNNLHQDFIEQLHKKLDGENVQELWIMSPFFDAKCQALEKLIDAFHPKAVNLVIQPKYVSLNPTALQRIGKKSKKKITIHPFETISQGQTAYVHAKLFLLKTASRAICLQGSPNCSQVAMLLPTPLGNIEVANLLTGKRQAFDNLFKNLDLQPATTNISDLEVAFRDIEPTPSANKQDWLLTSASWRGDMMLLYFRGGVPDLQKAKLVLGDFEFNITQVHIDNKEVQIKLPLDAQKVLSEHLVPIMIDTKSRRSSPIFPCNLEMLDREANTSSFSISTQDIQNFNPEDPEFENLLRELEASFPIDRKSIWQLAGKSASSRADDSEDDVYLDYDKIDYDLIRQHPKIQQYLHARGQGASGQGLTRLQQLMSAITAHFSELADVAFGKKKVTSTFHLEGASNSETEEEENGEIEQPLPPTKNRNRIRNALKRFINRYLRGLKSPDFVRLVGAEVIINNYVIFSHVLWRLLQKNEWIDNDFILESFFNIWVFFWGEEPHSGFVSTLSNEQRNWANELLRKHKGDALVLATLYHANWQSMLDGDNLFRADLCRFWRHILSSTPFNLNEDTLMDSWIYLHDLYPLNKPSPKRMVMDLQELAHASNTIDSLHKMEDLFNLRENSFQIKTDRFFRELDGRTTQSEYLEILAPISINGIEDAKKILLAWMESGNRDYHRVKMPGYIIYYDKEIGKGLYYDQKTGQEIEIDGLSIDSQTWEITARSLSKLASSVEKNISLNLSMRITY